MPTTKLKPRLDSVERCSMRALSLVMRLYGLTDGEVGQRIDMAAQQVQARRTGWTRIRPGELRQLAEALELPPGVFGMEPPDVLRYFAECVPVERWVAGESNPEPAVGGVIYALCLLSPDCAPRLSAAA